MTKEQIRGLLLALFDDEDGVNDLAHTELEKLALSSDNGDILLYLQSANGRWFLGEHDAETLRNVQSA